MKQVAPLAEAGEFPASESGIRLTKPPHRTTTHGVGADPQPIHEWHP